MIALLKFIADIVNNLHDYIIDICGALGLNFTDKSLHFWLIGGIGMLIFLLSDVLFKLISKWSVSVISFIYTSTVLVVLVFSLEIMQKITGRGNMEFADITAGLWGFIAVFAMYMGVRMIIFLLRKLMNRSKDSNFK